MVDAGARVDVSRPADHARNRVDTLSDLPPIAPEEYRERIARLATALAGAGLDAVVLGGESNVDYFSGYRHHAPWTLFARPFFEVVGADGRAVLIGHSFLIPEMVRTSAVEDVRTYTRSGGAACEPLADALRELGAGRGRIGAELGYEQRLGLAYLDFEALRDALPGVRFVDAAGLLWPLRMIKSPAEQALMRRAAGITAEAFDACFAAAREGVTERELGRIAGETMMRAGADRPGFILVASGAEGYRCLSGKPTTRALEHGDMLWMDLSAVYQGYWSDFCRAGIVGGPSPAHHDAQARILEVNQACVAAVRPGEPIRAVAEAAESAFAKLGMDVRVGDGRIGHGMGLMSTEPPHTALYDETIMEPGLVFTIEPRFVDDTGVYNCEELLLVTGQGAEILTGAPRGLRALG